MHTSLHTETIQQTDPTQHPVKVDHTDTVQQLDHINISLHTDTIPQTLHTGIMQQTDQAQDTGKTEHRDTSQDAVQIQVQMQTDGHILRNFTLESFGGIWQQTTISDDSGKLVSGNTKIENKSENPLQITASSVQLLSTTTQVQPKPKRPRLTWNSEALKALEESLGPLSALGGSLPGSVRLEQIRNSAHVLQKYSVEQIYQKLYTMNKKK